MNSKTRITVLTKSAKGKKEIIVAIAAETKAEIVIQILEKNDLKT